MKTATTTTALSADVLVIGFGKGGKVAAHVLTDAGKRVVLVEQSEDMYGGTCPNVGCVPTKMLVHYSNTKRLEDNAQEFFANSVAGVRALTVAFRAGNFEALDGKDTATVITGAARFVDAHTIALGEGTDRITVTVTAPTILINTGSEPIIPAIPGLANSSHLVSSTELIQKDQLPERLAVVGGGYLGLEFASIYQHFGAQVTVLEASQRLLPAEDTDVAQVGLFRTGCEPTAHRRFVIWSRAGVWGRLHEAVIDRIDECTLLDLSRVVLDSAHVRAKNSRCAIIGEV
jgi:pyruvate/2-oxoglutarate dehydrogenase complex dihydrolipoamide dehydrogenase (E3) component